MTSQRRNIVGNRDERVAAEEVLARQTEADDQHGKGQRQTQRLLHDAAHHRATCVSGERRSEQRLFRPRAALERLHQTCRRS